MTQTPDPAAPAGSPPARPCVAVLFGGRSSEHAISLITARGVLRAIDREKWDVVTVGIAPSGEWFLYPQEELERLLDEQPIAQLPVGEDLVSLPLKVGESELLVRQDGPCGGTVGRDRRVDVVLPLLHGPFGEDGTLQGLLELADLHYVGCGVTASAMGMDKHFMKLAFEAAGLEVGPYEVVTDRQWRADPDAVRERVAGLGLPVFVKPARAGSSFGITKVERPEDLDAAIATAREHDRKLVVEAAITGREIECAVLQGRGTDPVRTSMPGEIEIVDEHAFYDFEAKYVSQASARLSCPADLPAEAAEAVRAGAVRAFEALDGEGLCRADFFYTDDGRVVINEINTMPGFTPISMYPRMWAASGLSYPALIDELLSLALERPVGLR
ncbi:D-alanine--D-alanine ligase [Kocuria flava]|uniref:D-alanine--D-alanine ligase family protein n=1 Tax=Kocuria flava TaxID=446860 RepID=UPI001FF5131C|nr:D-alanine--D-alanine ligase family protein [Kocuria flava]MCJ8505835.1 D-alanine--D-alanine ligase [Kocuria flava]